MNRLAVLLGLTALIIAGTLLSIVAPGGVTPRSSRSSSSSAPSPTPTTSRPFSATSVWNAPLPADAALSPQSTAYTTELIQQIRADGAWINTYSYSVPVYTVGANQPTVPVTLDTSGSGVQSLTQAFREGVPIPNDAKPAAGTDEQMVILQPARNTMWEFWHLRRLGGAWHARWGGRMTDVSSNPGYFSNPSYWGASATSLPLLGGLIRLQELRAGRVDHALAIAIPHAAADVYAFPAQRTDGNDHAPGAIPEGTEFRLPPTLDLAKLALPPLTRIIAVAAQRYGIIVRDQAGAVTFYAEDPTPTGTSPYYGPHGLFGGRDPGELLRSFPWHDLEVVRPLNTGG